MEILGIILEKKTEDGFLGTWGEISPVVSLQNGTIKCQLESRRVSFELRTVNDENTFTVSEHSGIYATMEVAMKIGRELERVGYNRVIAVLGEDQRYTLEELSKRLESMATLKHERHSRMATDWMSVAENMNVTAFRSER